MIQDLVNRIDALRAELAALNTPGNSTIAAAVGRVSLLQAEVELGAGADVLPRLPLKSRPVQQTLRRVA